MGKTSKDLRRERFIELIDLFGSQVNLADRLDLAPSYVWQLKTGERGIGDRLARKIEETMGWPLGQMDTPREKPVVDGPRLHEPYREIQIVRSVQLGISPSREPPSSPPEQEETLVACAATDPNAYAMRVVGDAAAPAIRDGWVIVVQPGHDLVPGEFVLIERTNGVVLAYEFLFERNNRMHCLTPDGTERITIGREDIAMAAHISTFIAPSQIFSS